jgi:hypothetical protein
MLGRTYQQVNAYPCATAPNTARPPYGNKAGELQGAASGAPLSWVFVTPSVAGAREDGKLCLDRAGRCDSSFAEVIGVVIRYVEGGASGGFWVGAELTFARLAVDPMPVSGCVIRAENRKQQRRKPVLARTRRPLHRSPSFPVSRTLLW